MRHTITKDDQNVFKKSDNKSINETPVNKYSRSWVWNYFTRVDTNMARCKQCHKSLTRSSGTKGLSSHLLAVHGIKDSAEQTEKKSSSRSWFWEHFSRNDQNSAVCNYCQKVLSRSSGTKGLASHLIAIHEILRPKDQLANDDTKKRMKKVCPSWVWQHFKKINKDTARCKHCNKVYARSEGTKGLADHLLAKHSLSKDSSEVTGFTYRKSARLGSTRSEYPVIIKEKPNDPFLSSTDTCYICNTILSTLRTSLNTLTKFTETPLYQYLGKLEHLFDQ